MDKIDLGPLKDRIEETIISYRKKRLRNKIGAIIAQISMIIFSGATTVFIGWQFAEKQTNPCLLNIALIMSALTTGMGALDKFFDYKSFWVRYNVSIQQLKSILDKAEYWEMMGKLTPDKIEELYNKYDAVCSEMLRSYESIRTEKD